MRKKPYDGIPPLSPSVTLRQEDFEFLWLHCKDNDIKLGPWIGQVAVQYVKQFGGAPAVITMKNTNAKYISSSGKLETLKSNKD